MESLRLRDRRPSDHEQLGQDNLHSGPYKPVSLGPSDITALLPCDESDFEAGRIPERRAALEGTPPAIADPSLCSLRPRPLLASLMQVHNFWGIIARRILHNEKDWRPQDEDSEFAKLNRRLRDWERDLPPEHAFGRILLGGYRHYEEDLVSRLTMQENFEHVAYFESRPISV